MKLHLPHLLRRAVLRAMYAATALATTLFSASYADMITPDGRTATTVTQQGNVYNVYTNTVRGQTGFNSFSTFDVYADTTANLHLAHGTANLVNVVRDKCSYIDGVLNSYKDGQIGGNVFFLNPNGIVVGKSGVVNVGSITMSTPTAYFIEQLIARDGSISPTATAAVLAGDMPINEKGLISVKGKINAIDRVEMRAGTVEVQGTVSTKVKMADVVNTGGKKMDNKGMRIEGGKLSFGRKPRAARKPAHKAETPVVQKHDIEIFAKEVSIDGGMLAGETIYIDPDKLSVTNTTISGHYTAEARELTLNNVQSDHLQSLTLHAGNELADGTFAGDVSLTVTGSSLIVNGPGNISITADATDQSAPAAITISNSTIQALLSEGYVLENPAEPVGSVTIEATAEHGNSQVSVQNSTITGKDVSLVSFADKSANITLGTNAAINSYDGTTLTETGAEKEDGTPEVETETVSGSVTLLAASANGTTALHLDERTTVTAVSGDIDILAAGLHGAEANIAGVADSMGSVSVSVAAENGNASATLAPTGRLFSHAGDVSMSAYSDTGKATVTLEAGSTVNADTVGLMAMATDGDAAIIQNNEIVAAGGVMLTARVGSSDSENGFDEEGNYDPEQDTMEYIHLGGGNASVTVNGKIYTEGGIQLVADNTGTYGTTAVTVGEKAELAAFGKEVNVLGKLSLEREEGEEDEDYAARLNAYLNSLEKGEFNISDIIITSTNRAGDASLQVLKGAKLIANRSAELKAEAKGENAKAIIDFGGALKSGIVSVAAVSGIAQVYVREGAKIISVPVAVLITETNEEDDSVFYSAQKMDAGITIDAYEETSKQEGETDGGNTPLAPLPPANSGTLVEISGSLLANRKEEDGEGAGGNISLGSQGRLTITDTAEIQATSETGEGGNVSFIGMEYDLSESAVYTASGKDGAQGTFNVYYLGEVELSDILGDTPPVFDFMSNLASASTGASNDASDVKTDKWLAAYAKVTVSGKNALTQDVAANALTIIFKEGAELDGRGHSFSVTSTGARGAAISAYARALGGKYEIQDNVKITNVKDFVLKESEEDLIDTLVGISVANWAPHHFYIGNNVEIQASGSITLYNQANFWTTIQFGKNVNITAGKDINIYAKNSNGAGFTFFTSTPTDVAEKLKNGLTDEFTGQVNPALEGLNNLSPVKADIGKMVKLFLNPRLQAYAEQRKSDGKGSSKWTRFVGFLAKQTDPNAPSCMAGGFRVGFATISFAGNDKESERSTITSTGGNVNINASSTSTIKSKSKITPIGGAVSLTYGLIVNRSRISLGNTLDINAAYPANAAEANGEKADASKVGNVNITGSSNSILSLNSKVANSKDTSEDGSYVQSDFVGNIGVTVIYDDNNISLGKGSTIKALHDIKIANKSKINDTLILICGGGKKYEYKTPNTENMVQEMVELSENHGDEEGGGGRLFDGSMLVNNPADAAKKYAITESASSTKMLTFVTDILYHEQNTDIAGTLISKSGNIGVESSADVTSLHSISSDISYMLDKKDKKPDEQKSKFEKIMDDEYMKCFNFVGFTPIYNGYKDVQTIKDVMQDWTSGAFNEFQADSVDKTVAVVADIGVRLVKNAVDFSGTAIAENGNININGKNKLDYTSSVKSSIRGVPAQKAIAGTFSLPLSFEDCVVEVRGTLEAKDSGEVDAKRKRGNINITAVTDYPMKANFLNWRSWLEKYPDENMGVRITRGLGDLINFAALNYSDSSFGLLGNLTTTNATTWISGTGVGNKEKTEGTIVGGNVVVEAHKANTLVNIGDNARLSADHDIKLQADTTGQKMLFAGECPFSFPQNYLFGGVIGDGVFVSDKKAAAAFGFSTLAEASLLNTATYVGAATITADALTLDSSNNLIGIETAVAGSFGQSQTGGFNGAANVLIDNSMTFSKISDGAVITLRKGSSHINAANKSLLINLSGMEADGGKYAFGAGISATVDYSYTAALLGNNESISATAYNGAWNSLNTAANYGQNMRETGERPVILTFMGADGLDITATDNSKIVSVGIAASVLLPTEKQTEMAGNGADSVAVNYGTHHTLANSYKAEVTEDSADEELTENEEKKTKGNLTLTAKNSAAIVSVAGNIAAATGAAKVSEAVGFAVNHLGGDTLAKINEAIISTGGNVSANAYNTAGITAINLAGAGGKTKVGLAAGISWNDISGVTGAYTQNGSITAGKIGVDADSAQQIVAVTMGTSISTATMKSAMAAGEQNDMAALDRSIADSQGSLENILINIDENSVNAEDRDDIVSEAGAIEMLEMAGINPDEYLPEEGDALLKQVENGASVSVGASIAVSKVNTCTEALVIGTDLNAANDIAVTADDTTVVTQISGGVAVASGSKEERGIAAGAVLSFIPLQSKVSAEIVQADGVNKALTLNAGSLTLHASAAQNARNWSIGVAGASGTAAGGVVAWNNFNNSGAFTKLGNVNAAIGGGSSRTSAKKDVLVEALNKQSATVVSAGASVSTGNFAAEGLWNHVSFGGYAKGEISGSTININYADGRMQALAHSENSLFDLLGVANIEFNSDDEGLGGAGAAVSTVFLNKNGDAGSYTAQMLVKDSTISNSGTTEIKADSRVKGGVYGAAVGLTTQKAEVEGTFSWMTDYTHTEAKVENSTLTGNGGQFNVLADSSSAVTSGVGTAALQFSGGGFREQLGGAAALAVNIIKDEGTTEALVSNSTVNNTGSLKVRSNADIAVNGVAAGGTIGKTLAVTGQVMYVGLGHNVNALADGSNITLSGNLNVEALQNLTFGKGNVRLSVGSASVGYLGGGIGLSLLFAEDKGNTTAAINNGNVTAKDVTLNGASTTKGGTLTVTAAGGAFAGGVANVNRVRMADHSNALISGQGNIHARNLNITSTLNQELNTNAVGFAVGAGAVTINVDMLDLEGGSQALVSGSQAITLSGNLAVKAAAQRIAGYSAYNLGAGAGGVVVNVSLLNVSRNTDASLTDNADYDTKLNGLFDTAAGNVDALVNRNADRVSGDELEDYTGEAAVPEKVSLKDALKQNHVGEKSNVNAGLALANNTVTVAGKTTIASDSAITTKPSNLSLAVGAGSVGVNVTKTKMAPVTHTTLSGLTLQGKGDVSITATGAAVDTFDDCGGRSGLAAVGVSTYRWEDKADTAVTIGKNTKVSTLQPADARTGDITLSASNRAEETFKHFDLSAAAANVTVSVPRWEQSSTTAVTVQDGAVLESQNNLTLNSKNNLKLDADLLDVVVAAVGVAVPNPRLDINDHETISIGNNAKLLAEKGTLTLSNTADKQYNISQRHAGFSAVEISATYVTAYNTVDAAVTIGDGVQMKAKEILLNSQEDLIRKARLNGVTFGVLTLGTHETNWIEVTQGSANRISIGKQAEMSGNISVNATTTDNSIITTSAIHGGVITGGQIATIHNTVNLTDAITIGNGFRATGGSLTLGSDSVVNPLYEDGGSKSGGLLMDICLNLYEYADNNLTSTVTMGSGDIAVNRFAAHARTNAEEKVHNEVRGGALLSESRKGGVYTNTVQTAKVNLANGGEQLTLTADTVAVSARNERKQAPYNSNVDVSGWAGSFIPIIDVEDYVTTTLNAEVNWGRNATLKRRMTDFAANPLNAGLISFRAENKADIAGGVTGYVGGVFGHVHSRENVTTTANTAVNILGGISAWNDVDLAADSDITNTTYAENNTRALGGVEMSNVNNITLNNRLQVDAKVETVGSVNLSAHGTGLRRITNLEKGKDSGRGKEDSYSDSSALTINGNVMAARDISITTSKSLSVNGGVWAGLEGYMGVDFINSSTAPVIKGYIEYAQESLFGGSGAPALHNLSQETIAYLMDDGNGSMRPLSARSGLLTVSGITADKVTHADHLHVIKDAEVDIFIPFAYDQDITLGSVALDASGTKGAFIDGVPYAPAENTVADGGSQIHITNWSNNKLTLAGYYTAKNGGLNVYSVGNIGITGGSDTTWLNVYTEASLEVNNTYSAEQGLTETFVVLQRIDDSIWSKLKINNSAGSNRYESLDTGKSIDGAHSVLIGYPGIGYPGGDYYYDYKIDASKSHNLHAMQDINIHAKVVDVNGDIIAGRTEERLSLTFNDMTKLIGPSDSAADKVTIISIDEAQKLYKQNPSVSKFKVANTQSGVNCYFDAAENRFVVSDISGEDHHITIEADAILSTRPQGMGKIQAQVGTFDVDIVNNSSFALDVSNLNLNPDTKGIITLKDQSGTVTYTCNTAGDVTEERNGEILHPDGYSFTLTPQWNYLHIRSLHETEERTTPSSWTVKIVGDVAEAFADATYEGVNIENQTNALFYHQDPLSSYYDSLWDGDAQIIKRHAYRDTYIRADHAFTVGFGGVNTDHGSLAVRSNGSINLAGNIFAKLITMRSETGDIRLDEDAALCGKESLALNAFGNIIFGEGSTMASPMVDLTATGSIGTAGAWGTVVGDTQLGVRSGADLYLKATHNVDAGQMNAARLYLEVGGNLRRVGNARLEADVAELNVGGGVMLDTKVSNYLAAEAGQTIALHQDDDTVLTLRHLTSRNGNINVFAAKGIQAYYNLDLNKVLTDETLEQPLSLKDAAKFYSDEYKEAYYREMAQFRLLYDEKDANGNFLYRDAENRLVLTEEQKKLRVDSLRETFLEEYNSGRGDALVNAIYQLNESAYVGGKSFNSRSDAEAYICTHLAEAADAYAHSQYDAALQQVTLCLTNGVDETTSTETHINNVDFNKDLWRLYYENAHNDPDYVAVMEEVEWVNPATGETVRTLKVNDRGGYIYVDNDETQLAITDWLRRSKMGEQLYRQYWQKDADGHLMYQDAEGNFTGPLGPDGETPVYSEEMRALVTDLYKGTPEARGYVMTDADKARLVAMGEQQSGYTQAEQLLDAVKNSLHTLSVGSAPVGTETVISAKNGNVHLSADAQNGSGIGSNRMVLLLTADSTDEQGRPVYSKWAKDYITEAQKGQGLTILSGGLDAAETRVRIDSRSFTEADMTALDVATLLASDSVTVEPAAGSALNRYTITPLGYLGTEAKQLTLVSGGNDVYVSSAADMNLSAYTLGGNAHLSAAGDINSGAVFSEGSGTHTLNMTAGGNIGMADGELVLAGTTPLVLNMFAEGDIRLGNEAKDVSFKHVAAENISIRNKGTLKGIEGELNNPNIFAKSISWLHDHIDSTEMGKKDAPLYIATWGNNKTDGFRLESSYSADIFNSMVINSGDTLYPFIFHTGDNVARIDEMEISFSGGLYIDTQADIGTLTLTQRHFTEGSLPTAIQYNAVFVDGNLTLHDDLVVHAENNFDFTLPGTLTFPDKEKVLIDMNTNSGTVSIGEIEAGPADLEYHSGADTDILGPVAARSFTAAGRGDMTLAGVGVENDISVSLGEGALQSGILSTVQGNISLHANGDIDVISLLTPHTAEATSALGTITLGRSMADHIALTAKGDITADVTAVSGDKLWLDSAVAKSGTVNLRTESQDLRLTGAVKGRAVTLSNTGLITTDGGRISAPTGKLSAIESLARSAEEGKIAIRLEEDGYHITADKLLTELVEGNTIVLPDGVHLEMVTEAAHDFPGTIFISKDASMSVRSDFSAASLVVNGKLDAMGINLVSTADIPAELRGSGILTLGADSDFTAADLMRFTGLVQAQAGQLRLPVQLNNTAVFSADAEGSVLVAPKGVQMSVQNGGIAVSGLQELSGNFVGQHLLVQNTETLALRGGWDIAEESTLRGVKEFTAKEDFVTRDLHAQDTDSLTVNGSPTIKDMLLLQGLTHITFNAGVEADRLKVLESDVLTIHGKLSITGEISDDERLRVLTFQDSTTQLDTWFADENIIPFRKVVLNNSSLAVQNSVTNVRELFMSDSAFLVADGCLISSKDVNLRAGKNTITGSLEATSVLLTGYDTDTQLEMHGGILKAGVLQSIEDFLLDAPNTDIDIDSFRAENATMTVHGGAIGALEIGADVEKVTVNQGVLHLGVVRDDATIRNMVLNDGSFIVDEGLRSIGSLTTTGTARFGIEEAVSDLNLERIETTGVLNMQLLPGTKVNSQLINVYTNAVLDFGKADKVQCSLLQLYPNANIRAKELAVTYDITLQQHAYYQGNSISLPFHAVAHGILHISRDCICNHTLDPYYIVRDATGMLSAAVGAPEPTPEDAPATSAPVPSDSVADVLTSAGGDTQAAQNTLITQNELTTQATPNEPTPQNVLTTQATPMATELTSQNVLTTQTTPMATELNRLSSGITAPATVGGSMGDSISAPVINFADSEESDGEKEDEKRKVTAR